MDTSAILDALYLYVFLPLEIGTLIQISELELLEDKGAARQVEDICKCKFL